MSGDFDGLVSSDVDEGELSIFSCGRADADETSNVGLVVTEFLETPLGSAVYPVSASLLLTVVEPSPRASISTRGVALLVQLDRKHC